MKEERDVEVRGDDRDPVGGVRVDRVGAVGEGIQVSDSDSHLGVHEGDVDEGIAEALDVVVAGRLFDALTTVVETTTENVTRLTDIVRLLDGRIRVLEDKS